jgi:hypothetical protein
MRKEIASVDHEAFPSRLEFRKTRNRVGSFRHRRHFGTNRPMPNGQRISN